MLDNANERLPQKVFSIVPYIIVPKVSWFGHVCRHDTMPKKKQWMVVVADEDLVNQGRTISRNGHASRCRHCCASQITEIDGQSDYNLNRRFRDRPPCGWILARNCFVTQNPLRSASIADVRCTDERDMLMLSSQTATKS